MSEINIFARKPSNLPAKRYEQWISVFEKHVSEVQKRISRVQKLEPVYNVVRSVLEAAKLPNETKINISEGSIGSIDIHIAAVETDHSETFELLRERIGHALVTAGLRERPDGAVTRGGWYKHMSFQWHLQRKIGEDSRVVHLVVGIPKNGIADFAVIEKREEYTSYHLTYEFVPRSKLAEGKVI